MTFISVLHYYKKCIIAHHSIVNPSIDNKPALSMEGVFKRKKNSESSVTSLSFLDSLTDGEDPQLLDYDDETTMTSANSCSGADAQVETRRRKTSED
jgi:hypothetical protein